MTTIYFEKPGRENTRRTLDLVKKVASQKGIKKIVLASVTGYTAQKALEHTRGLKLIVVGIKKESFPPELITRLLKKGHALFFRGEIEAQYPPEMKSSFQRYSQGAQIALEIALIAVLKKALKVGEEAITVAGTGAGADTALVVKAAQDLEYLKVEELICKPYFS